MRHRRIREPRGAAVVAFAVLLVGCASRGVPSPDERGAAARAASDEVSALIAAGELEQAELRAEELLAIDPVSPVHNMAAARAKAALGKRDGRPRLYADAIRFADAAVQSDPDNAEARKSRALLQYERRHFTKALADLADVTAASPGDVDAWRLAARCHRGLRQPKREREAWEQVLRQRPDDVEAHVELGSRVLAAASRTKDDSVEADEAAERHLRRAVELAPEDPLALHALADHALRQERHGEAETLLKRAIFAAQGDVEREADALFSLGAAVQAQGRHSEARDYYQRAAALAPDDARVHGNLGYVLIQLGDLEGARVSLTRARDLEEDSSRRHRVERILAELDPPVKAKDR